MNAIRRLSLLAATCLVAACNTDSTGPLIDDGSPVSLDGGALGVVAASGGSAGATAMVPRLPADLKLSDAQRAQITQLVLAFQDATRADMLTLVGIQRQAEAARKAGKSNDEIRAILQTGATIRSRIEAADKKLRADIEAVLTPAQLAWIRANSPKACNGAGVMLSHAQQAEIRNLMVAFEQANRVDLIAVARALEQARSAKRAGKTDAEVRAILQGVSAAQARIETAHKALQDQINAVLTAEQRASGCFTRRP